MSVATRHDDLASRSDADLARAYQRASDSLCSHLDTLGMFHDCADCRVKQRRWEALLGEMAHRGLRTFP